jgi:hypothetical protein
VILKNSLWSRRVDRFLVNLQSYLRMKGGRNSTSDRCRLALLDDAISYHYTYSIDFFCVSWVGHKVCDRNHSEVFQIGIQVPEESYSRQKAPRLHAIGH